ncbi:hypothetical protein ABPG72_012058 [Tetrahymena utriculariae]
MAVTMLFKSNQVSKQVNIQKKFHQKIVAKLPTTTSIDPSMLVKNIFSLNTKTSMPNDRTISVYQRGETIEASSNANEREKKNSARYPQTDIINVQKKQSKLGTNQVGDQTRQRDATTTVAQKLYINQAAEGHLYQS